ncbi:MAG: bis(5'-nucleosyl)-tetraphosphatase (symmetrical) YqeK [Atopobiaceae bacterium]|jgi:predicted HD superfamily hydrolase involved in NAD metabolism
MTSVEVEILERLTHDVRIQLAKKPKRLEHSLRVSAEAVRLAEIYGVNTFEACAAGLLHDWDKALSAEEQIRRAEDFKIDMGVPLKDVVGLLHGLIAQKELPKRYPELPASVFQAIGRHTLGAWDMSPLDEVIFVADGIEPGRPQTPSLEELRGCVGTVDLDELFWRSFTSGIVYVIETERYLYPGTIRIYNELWRTRANR